MHELRAQQPLQFKDYGIREIEICQEERSGDSNDENS